MFLFSTFCPYFSSLKTSSLPGSNLSSVRWSLLSIRQTWRRITAMAPGWSRTNCWDDLVIKERTTWYSTCLNWIWYYLLEDATFFRVEFHRSMLAGTWLQSLEKHEHVWRMLWPFPVPLRCCPKNTSFLQLPSLNENRSLFGARNFVWQQISAPIFLFGGRKRVGSSPNSFLRADMFFQRYLKPNETFKEDVWEGFCSDKKPEIWKQCIFQEFFCGRIFFSATWGFHWSAFLSEGLQWASSSLGFGSSGCWFYTFEVW